MFVVILVMIRQCLNEEVVEEGALDILSFLIHLSKVLFGYLIREDRVQGFLL